jgi:hypothetical protein
MSWQKIGDVTRDVTNKLQEPFAVVICFHEWAADNAGNDSVGIVAFNHPHGWSPTADEIANSLIRPSAPIAIDIRISWRPASCVPAGEQRSRTESRVESLKDWLIRPNGKVH